jgi:hypothetical protein
LIASSTKGWKALTIVLIDIEYMRVYILDLLTRSVRPATRARVAQARLSLGGAGGVTMDAQQRYQFEVHGYLHVPGVLTPAEAARLCALAQSLGPEPGQGGELLTFGATELKMCLTQLGGAFKCVVVFCAAALFHHHASVIICAVIPAGRGGPWKWPHRPRLGGLGLLHAHKLFRDVLDHPRISPLLEDICGDRSGAFDPALPTFRADHLDAHLFENYGAWWQGAAWRRGVAGGRQSRLAGTCLLTHLHTPNAVYVEYSDCPLPS